MIVFASEKRKKPDPKPGESSSGKVFMRGLTVSCPWAVPYQ